MFSNINNDLVKVTISVTAIAILFLFYYASKKKTKYIKALGITGIVYSIIYIVWRTFFTLPPILSIGFIFGIILLLTEFMGLEQTLVFRIFFSTDKKIKPEPDTRFETPPTIDVIVSTYNESVNILKRTLVGCKNIDYPKDKINIYIGDDGRRVEVEELTKNCGIHYITRDDNAHAKAGNINNVLKYSDGEFILLLDADMIPSKEIINAMLYFFEDSKTGFVQSPQVFYNLDPFQHNLNMGPNIPNEQDFFMRSIEEKRANYNAVLHVGTNALFRRSAIEAIGGIPTGSITEDMATGMLLQNSGYKSFFIKEALALGLSVENMEDLVKQRDRWCRGSVQVIKKHNPLKMKGLNIVQKLIYLDGFFFWLFGVRKMIYIIAPLLFLLLRTTLFVTNTFDLFMIYLPFYISSQLYFKAVTNGGRNGTWSHIYDISIAPYIASSFLMEFLFNKRSSFRVTPKGNTTNKDIYQWRLALPHLVILVLSIMAIVLNIKILFNPLSIYWGAVLINMIWCLYNLMAILISIFLFMDRSRFRRTERMSVDLKASALFTNCDHCDACDFCGKVVDISEEGLRILLKESCPSFTFKEGSEISLKVENIGELPGRIVKLLKVDDKYDIGIRFGEVGFNEFAKINQYRFDLRNQYVNRPSIHSDYDTLVEVIFRQFKRRNK